MQSVSAKSPDTRGGRISAELSLPQDSGFAGFPTPMLPSGDGGAPRRSSPVPALEGGHVGQTFLTPAVARPMIEPGDILVPLESLFSHHVMMRIP